MWDCGIPDELLQQQLHQQQQHDDNSIIQYVLVANGTDKDLVLKVPQLHLARLFVDPSSTPIIFGTKVVNRTLGDPVDVCGKLVDAARQQDGAKLARCALHGLSDYVLLEQQQNDFPLQFIVDMRASKHNEMTGQFMIFL